MRDNIKHKDKKCVIRYHEAAKCLQCDCYNVAITIYHICEMLPTGKSWQGKSPEQKGLSVADDFPGAVVYLLPL